MSLRALLFTVVAAATITSLGAATIDHDKVQPFSQPAPVTISEKSAVKFKPSLIIDGRCHPYPAVNAAGETSGGLKGVGENDGDCKGSGLGSQVYGRAVWHKDRWVIMYAWYFPKDFYDGFFGKVCYRHSWVNAVVWLDNPALENPTVLAVSAVKGDGEYDIMRKDDPPKCTRWNQYCSPPLTDYFNGTRPMLVYVLESFMNTPLRMTTAKMVEFQDLVMWEQLTEEARSALSETDYGKKAKVPFIDANFNANIEKSAPI